jgi:hypothetical protein
MTPNHRRPIAPVGADVEKNLRLQSAQPLQDHLLPVELRIIAAVFHSVDDFAGQLRSPSDGERFSILREVEYDSILQFVFHLSGARINRKAGESIKLYICEKQLEQLKNSRPITGVVSTSVG